VKLILEEQPRGKGFAVRTGLKAATGDYVLIQDADLEYDLEDYDALAGTAGRRAQRRSCSVPGTAGAMSGKCGSSPGNMA
jgi:glycosyltransferase involved in cell wall biosynthesis